MPIIRLYVFLLDFLIPFLCDPDLQCGWVGDLGTRPKNSKFELFRIEYCHFVLFSAVGNITNETIFSAIGYGVKNLFALLVTVVKILKHYRRQRLKFFSGVANSALKNFLKPNKIMFFG
jgi:hypothetical protein